MKLGTLLNTRDKNGWRIPGPGTKSATIYALLRQGKTRHEIWQIVGGSYSSLGVLIYMIKHPGSSNDMARGHVRSYKQRLLDKNKGRQ